MNIKNINKEYLLIAIVWIFVYTCVPLYLWYAGSIGDFDFNVGRMFGLWMTTTVFMLLFVVHHFVLVPRFFMRKRYAVYAMALMLCMVLFAFRMVSHTPKHFEHKEEKHRIHEGMPFHEDMKGRMPKRPHEHRNMLAPPDVACILMALMMLGLDLSFVAWMNSQKLRRRLLLLEKQNLKQELEHLRYQINPHFFMNTLNNIHVLVDVDQERAKRAIIELSGLMRHSLYNGGDSMTTLQNEIIFLRQYISLMQLRFGSHVEIAYHLPDAPSQDIMMPPLVFATFIENAFKHGISRKAPSYIIVSLAVDDETKTIHFRCENSRHEAASATHDGYHGIGLSNVRKRLDLQYGNDYTLCISDDNPDKFLVELILPVRHTNKIQ